MLTILGLVGNIIRAHVIIYEKRIFTSLMNKDIHIAPNIMGEMTMAKIVFLYPMRSGCKAKKCPF